MTGNILLLTIVFLPLALAFVSYLAGRKSERLRDFVVFAAVIAAFAASFLLILHYQGVELRLVDWGAFALHFRADGFRVLYACVTAFLWLVTTVFSPEYLAHSRNRSRYWLFNLLTLGAVMGVFFSADFRTAFLFFEIMSFCSYVLVAHNDDPKTLRAAETYLAFAVIGGLVQLMGMALLFHRAGTLEFAALYEVFAGMPDKSLFYLPGVLLLIGFGAKAGMYPLHVWLPKAYPAAPAPATALLSGILSKTGIFGLVAVTANIFMNDYVWGITLLIPATVTMLFGAALAVFSDDMKRTLAGSSISQVGFILIGVAMLGLSGDYNALAAHGTLLHMLNHSLFKLVLFLTAGIVFMNLRELKLDKIRGFGRGKPLFLFAFLMAALGVTGVPFGSGFISKVLLKKSLSDGYYFFQGLPLEHLQGLAPLLRFSYMAMIFTGGLTLAYMTKLFVTLFVQKSEGAKIQKGEKRRYISIPAAIALTISAALVPLLGSLPWTMDSLALWGEGFFRSGVPQPLYYFTPENIRSAATSFAIGAAVYLLVVRGLMTRRGIHINFWPTRLDLETLIYRPVLGLLTLAPIIRSEKIHTPGRFLSQALSRRIQLLQKNPVIIGHSSLDLLFVGIGVSTAVVYVFIRAFL